jgi:phosphohistidine phosphatase
LLNPEVKAQERTDLAPLDDVKEIASQIRGANKDLLITGHLPHLGKLASLLVSGDEAIAVVKFQQGGVVCLEKDEEDRWTVDWMVVPELIRRSV